jgi:SAM-dependent methyltransferase
MSVLDAGCGNGDVSLLAAELVSSSGRVVGFDRDPRQVSVASARVTNTEIVSFVQATVNDPPVGDSTRWSVGSCSCTSPTSSLLSRRWLVACGQAVWWPLSS